MRIGFVCLCVGLVEINPPHLLASAENGLSVSANWQVVLPIWYYVIALLRDAFPTHIRGCSAISASDRAIHGPYIFIHVREETIENSAPRRKVPEVRRAGRRGKRGGGGGEARRSKLHTAIFNAPRFVRQRGELRDLSACNAKLRKRGSFLPARKTGASLAPFLRPRVLASRRVSSAAAIGGNGAEAITRGENLLFPAKLLSQSILFRR